MAGHNLDKKLAGLLERIENLEEEKKGIAGDISDMFKEAKALGYNATAMRDLIRQRKMDADVRKERNGLLHAYAESIGLELL